MSLYKNRAVPRSFDGFQVSIASVPLLIYSMFGFYVLYKVTLKNLKYLNSPDSMVGLGVAFALSCVALIAAFRKEKLYIWIGISIALILLVVAFFGREESVSGVVFFVTVIWLDPSFALRDLIGYSDEISLRQSHLLNALPSVIVFVFALVARKFGNSGPSSKTEE